MSKSVEKCSLERQLQRLEEENCCLIKQVQELQCQLSEAEQQYAQKLIDLTTRNRKESELELERIRSSQVQSERQLESREKCHRQRIKCLEEQIATLRDQLSREIRNRQTFLTTTACVDEEIKTMHNILSDSLQNIARADPCIDTTIIDVETRRLNESMGNYSHETPVRNRSPPRRCASPITRVKFHSRF